MSARGRVSEKRETERERRDSVTRRTMKHFTI